LTDFFFAIEGKNTARRRYYGEMTPRIIAATAALALALLTANPFAQATESDEAKRVRDATTAFLGDHGGRR
jgi:hypothetical protein